MATKRTSATHRKVKTAPVIEQVEMTEMTVESTTGKRRITWLPLLLLALLGLVLFWQKTNTWPVAAIVNGRPISRFEVDRQLYKQGGQQTLDGLISQRLIESEIARQKVTVSADEVNKRLDEIKQSLGENFNSALQAQGLTEESVKKQLSLQLSMEKILADKATVSAEEIKQIAPDGNDVESAEKYLKQQKLQQAISTWVEELKTKSKIFIVGATPSPAATAQ
jgi:foldase protein PrsA